MEAIKEAAIETLEQLVKTSASEDRTKALELALDALKYPLLAFVKEEVPFRLAEIHGIADADPELVDELIADLYDHSDVMFDYDAVDDYLREKLDERGIEHQ